MRLLQLNLDKITCVVGGGCPNFPPTFEQLPSMKVPQQSHGAHLSRSGKYDVTCGIPCDQYAMCVLYGISTINPTWQ